MNNGYHLSGQYLVFDVSDDVEKPALGSEEYVKFLRESYKNRTYDEANVFSGGERQVYLLIADGKNFKDLDVLSFFSNDSLFSNRLDCLISAGFRDKTLFFVVARKSIPSDISTANVFISKRLGVQSRFFRWGSMIRRDLRDMLALFFCLVNNYDSVRYWLFRDKYFLRIDHFAIKRYRDALHKILELGLDKDLCDFRREYPLHAKVFPTSEMYMLAIRTLFALKPVKGE